jgi:hypothetical protein
MGTCMQQSTLALPPVVNQCYSNGVKISTSITISGGGGSIVSTYSKMGNVCYSAEVASAGTGQNATITYKNAAGTTVATGNYTAATMKFTVTCTGGMTYDLSSAACANVPRGTTAPGGGGDAGAGSCPMGSCP